MRRWRGSLVPLGHLVRGRTARDDRFVEAHETNDAGDLVPLLTDLVRFVMAMDAKLDRILLALGEDSDEA